jgi:hypothetical protein
VDAAGKYAHAAAKEAAYLRAQERSGVTIWKVWVTRFGPGTCPTCLKKWANEIGERSPDVVHVVRQVAYAWPHLSRERRASWSAHREIMGRADREEIIRSVKPSKNGVITVDGVRVAAGIKPTEPFSFEGGLEELGSVT